jgi:hypothetical protein
VAHVQEDAQCACRQTAVSAVGRVHEVQLSGHPRNESDSDFLSQTVTCDETECIVQQYDDR